MPSGKKGIGNKSNIDWFKSVYEKELKKQCELADEKQYTLVADVPDSEVEKFKLLGFKIIN